jgi:hypothetical protein
VDRALAAVVELCCKTEGELVVSGYVERPPETANRVTDGKGDLKVVRRINGCEKKQMVKWNIPSLANPCRLLRGLLVQLVPRLSFQESTTLDGRLRML